MLRATNRVLLAAAVVCVTASASFAQQTTTATATKKFEVLSVDGSQLVVRLPEGTRELSVPDDFRFDVDGQQLSVQQLKPGMKGTATITTKTTVTPVSVTEIKNGTVMQASGSTIIVRTDEGFKSFTQGDVDKRGVKIIREGKPAQVSDFRTGDKLSATIITSKPAHVLTEREVKATLAKVPPEVAAAAAPTMAPPPAAATTGAAPAAPRALPKTASSWPALGLAGILSLAMGLALTIRRRSVG
jgi:LPXTG-motif cell wall-anchored protein